MTHRAAVKKSASAARGLAAIDFNATAVSALLRAGNGNFDRGGPLPHPAVDRGAVSGFRALLLFSWVGDAAIEGRTPRRA
jgi:hypothetical protein